MRVVWSVFWRCALLSLLLGAFLGDLYGYLIAALLTLRSNIQNLAPAVQVIQATLFGLDTPRITGLPSVVLVGVTVGTVDGLVLGLVARLQLAAPPRIPRHRSVPYAVSALVTVLVGGWQLVRAEPSVDLGWPLTAYLLLYFVPILFITLAQWWIASRVVVSRLGLAGLPTHDEANLIRDRSRSLLREITLAPALVLLVGLLGGGTLVFLPRGPASPAVPIAVPYQRISGPEVDALSYLGSLVWPGGPDELIVSAQRSGAENPRLYLVALDGSFGRYLDFTVPSICTPGTPTLSGNLSALADGRIAFAQHYYCGDSHRSYLLALDVRTGKTQLLYPYPLPAPLTRVSVANDLRSAVGWESMGGGYRLLPDRSVPLMTYLDCPGPRGLSPDGKTMAVIASPDRVRLTCSGENELAIMLADLTSPAKRPLTRPFVVAAPESRSVPVWSPDGRWIAVSVVVPVERWFDKKSSRQELWLVEVASGRIYRPLTDPLRVEQLAWSPDSRRLAFIGVDEEVARQTRGLQMGLYVLDLSQLVESPPS